MPRSTQSNQSGSKKLIQRRHTNFLYAVNRNHVDVVKQFIEEGNVDINRTFRGNTPLHICIKKNFFELAQYLLSKQANIFLKNRHVTPLEMALSKKNEPMVQLLLAHGAEINIVTENLSGIGSKELLDKLFWESKIFNTPLKNIITNMNFFSTAEKMIRFIHSYQKCEFLIQNKLVTALAEEMFRLTLLSEIHRRQIRMNYFHIESAMDDRLVIQANTWFSDVIVPNFHQELMRFSSDSSEESAIENIHYNIRKFLLDEILQQAETKNNEQTIEFINENKNALLNMEEDAMKQSCHYFKSKDSFANSAWQGFNAWAPVSGDWPNLLTPMNNSRRIWTTKVDASEGNRTGQEVYETLRKRIAYYYIVANDRSDSESGYLSRVQNFISQLADIRNSHKIDDPSCYPGTITRIANIGAFHPVAQLPCEKHDKIKEFIRSKIIRKFSEFLASHTHDDNELLFDALILITLKDVEHLIRSGTRCDPKKLNIRRAFIQLLGTPEECLIEFNQEYPDLKLKWFDSVHFDYFLENCSLHENSMLLTNCYRKSKEKVPTQEELAQANPFDVTNEAKYHQIFQLVFDVLKVCIPEIEKNALCLKEFSEYMLSKIPLLFKEGDIDGFLAQYDEKIEDIPCVKQKISDILVKSGADFIVKNPFDASIAALSTRLAQPMVPHFQTIFNKKLQTLTCQQKLFSIYESRLKDVPHRDALSVVDFSKIVEVFVQNTNLDTYEIDIQESMLNICNLNLNLSEWNWEETKQRLSASDTSSALSLMCR